MSHNSNMKQHKSEMPFLWKPKGNSKNLKEQFFFKANKNQKKLIAARLGLKTLNDLEVKTSASQGEKTIFFSQLKKAEAEHIKTKNKEPIILLDDILSKLDDSNLEKIILLFKENTQTIITAANPIQTKNYKKLFSSTNINQININD